MLGAILRKQWNDPEKNQGRRVVSVSIMPCTAKKDEIKRTESSTFGGQDIDISLTSREIISLLNMSGIDLAAVKEEKPDVPYGTGLGGGELFGVTGGVTEAALRYLLPDVEEESLRALSQVGVRGEEEVRIFTFPYGGRELRIAVGSGLKNARDLMERVRSGEKFDLIEIMACPGGCIMGGGQPSDVYTKNKSQSARKNGLYESDRKNELKRANENDEIARAFDNVIKEDEHKLLHRNFNR